MDTQMDTCFRTLGGGGNRTCIGPISKAVTMRDFHAYAVAITAGRCNELIVTCCLIPFPWSPLESSSVLEK